MKKIKIFCSWDLVFDLSHEKQVELYVDKIPTDPIPNNTIRFVFLLEPPEILNISQHALWGLHNNTFQHLLTHNQELINQTDKSILFPFASTWIQNYQFPEKSFSVSTLVGGKLMAPGHNLRHKLWFKENKISVPKRFFLSGNFGGIENYNNNPILGKDKSPLFDSQFHICIENTKRDNWFTEKLIDCFVTKTIPIYWGCPNIGDWFNLKGMFIVDNVDDIIYHCNNLNNNTYNEMLSYIEENFKIALTYADLSERLKSIITKVINEQK